MFNKKRLPTTFALKVLNHKDEDLCLKEAAAYKKF